MSATIDISLSRSGDDVYECEDCGHVWHVPRELAPAHTKRAQPVLPGKL
jgi:hypothetical protein